MKMHRKTILAMVSMAVLVPLITFGSTLFTVDDSGNVGIGTSSPLHKLDVVGAIYSRLVTATDSSSTTIDWSSGNVQSITLSTNTTLAFTDGQAGGEYTLILSQDSTGGRTLTWPASASWPGGLSPTLTSAANGKDMVKFVYDGSNYLGSSVLNLSAAHSSGITDNFDSYSTGDLNGQGGWTANSTQFDIENSVSDTSPNGTTQHAVLTNNIAYKALPASAISGNQTIKLNVTSLGANGDVFGLNIYKGTPNLTDPAVNRCGYLFIKKVSGNYDLDLGASTESTLSSSITTSAWHTLDFQWDGTMGTNGKIRARMDGGSWSSWADPSNSCNFSSGGITHAGLWVETSSGTNTFYFDSMSSSS